MTIPTGFSQLTKNTHDDEYVPRDQIVKRNFIVIALICLICGALYMSSQIIRSQQKDQKDQDFFKELLGSSEKCPKGYTLYHPTKKCFKVVYKPKTFHNAFLTCLENGATLASIEDVKENGFLVNLFKDSESSESQPEAFWTGLVHHHRKWMWLDKIPVKFTNWDEGMPRFNKKNGCVVMETKDGKWKNVHCHEKKAFVCQS